jgi:hypothetical protein
MQLAQSAAIGGDERGQRQKTVGLLRRDQERSDLVMQAAVVAASLGYEGGFPGRPFERGVEDILEPPPTAGLGHDLPSDGSRASVGRAPRAGQATGLPPSATARLLELRPFERPFGYPAITSGGPKSPT